MSYDPRKVAFIDIETTGLHPTMHHVWEIAVIADATEYVWQQRLTDWALGAADPVALELTGFHSRYDAENALPVETSMQRLIALTRDRHLVGACPWFDERRLDGWLPSPWMRHDPVEGDDTSLTPWHYHLIDVEALMVGYLAARPNADRLHEAYIEASNPGIDMDKVRAGRAERALPTFDFELPWKSRDLSLAVGVNPDDFEPKHSAITDTRWAKACFEAVMGGPDAVR